MKRQWKWWSAGLAGALAVLVVLVVSLAQRTYDVPLPALAASRDPERVARGRYLAYGPAHCVECHGAQGAEAEGAGEARALSGGMTWRLPFGTVRAPNLTPDVETGLGALSDGQLARALRHGVRRDGQVLLPFMPFADLSDEDLVALLSFLRSQAPVRNAVVTRELNPVGWAVLAFVMRPQGPTQPPRAAVAPAPTAEYGEYLARSVANCGGCHTQRNLATGAFTGPALAGGTPTEVAPGVTLTPPNLTPSPRGRLAGWSEDAFVARMKAGVGMPHSHMPWKAFARMHDDDLRALYRYLRAVPAADLPEAGASPGAVAAR